MYGAGGHAKVLLDAALLCDRYSTINIVSDKADDVGKKLFGITIKSANNLLRGSSKFLCIIAIGDNTVRSKIFEKVSQAGIVLETICHPRAMISPSATIGPGSFIGGNAVLQAHCSIGSNTIVNTAAIIEHDCRVGKSAHVSPGAVLAGGVSIGSGSWIGAGAVVKDNINIGANVIVGAGSVVIRDVASNSRIAGVPAAEIR